MNRSTEPSPEVGPRPPQQRRKRMVAWRSRDIARAAALALGVFWLARLFWIANPLFLTAFLGVLFGLAVSAGVDRLAFVRIPRGAKAGLIVLAFIGALVGFGASVAPTLREQGGELQRKIPEAIDRVEHWIDQKKAGPLSIVLPPSTVPVTTQPKDTLAAPVAPTLRQRLGDQ